VRGGAQQQLASTVDASSVTFTPDGNRLVALGTKDGRSTLEIWNRDGTPLGALDVATLATEFADAGGVLPGLAPERAVAVSVSPDAEGGRLLVVLDDAAADVPSVLTTVDITERGTGAIVAAAGFPVEVLQQGAVQAVAR
jgi:hypothetical protein